jgi:hypothetical protein
MSNLWPFPGGTERAVRRSHFAGSKPFGCQHETAACSFECVGLYEDWDIEVRNFWGWTSIDEMPLLPPSGISFLSLELTQGSPLFASGRGSKMLRRGSAKGGQGQCRLFDPQKCGNR